MVSLVPVVSENCLLEHAVHGHFKIFQFSMSKLTYFQTYRCHQFLDPLRIITMLFQALKMSAFLGN